jgi:hypothetical protein
VVYSALGSAPRKIMTFVKLITIGVSFLFLFITKDGRFDKSRVASE